MSSDDSDDSSYESSPRSSRNKRRKTNHRVDDDLEPAAATPFQAGNPAQGGLDILAAAGVDLAAEEEAIRRSNYNRQASAGPSTGHLKSTPLVSKEELQARIQSIANAVGGLRSLKADALDLLSTAIQHRLRSLIDDMLQSRNHRLMSQPNRPPPMHDFDPENPDVLPSAMWDELFLPDAAKALAIIDRVEKEEERLARRERVMRDAAEQEAKEAMEENRRSESEDEKPQKGKRGPKKKNPSVTQTARNLPEDMQKKMTDKTAQATLFGKQSKYAWLQGGAAGASTAPRAVKNNTIASALPTSAQLPLQYGVEVSDRIVWQDLEFALEHERGSGAGIGTGSTSLYKAMATRQPLV